MTTPRVPILAEALRLFFGRAHVQRQHRLAQGHRVGERSDAHPVKTGDRDDGEVGDLRRRLLALAVLGRRGVQGGGVIDAIEVAPGEKGDGCERDHDQQRDPGSGGEVRPRDRDRELSRFPDVFDRAIATFAEVYADQNERDHAALVDAIATGRVQPGAER